jgi:glycosyltransferase involved in cell wall biosynthesis
MRIGIDCRHFYDVHANKGAGIERYTYHLVKTLLQLDTTNQFVLFFYSDLSPETIYKAKGNNPRIRIVKLFRSTSKIPLYDNHIRFVKVLKQAQLDLTVFPANIIPLFYKGKSLLIIHDLAIYLHPEWFPDKQWFATRVLVPRSLKKAETIVAISQSTKRDLLKLFKRIPEEKVRVIHPGVKVKDEYMFEEAEKVMKKFDIKDDYILFIGTIEPRKNIANLIKAFSNYLFDHEESKVNLVLAGIRGWKFQPIFQFLKNINQRLPESQIKYIGKVSNRERNILIKKAQAFVFPSKYEGFGFPVVEAMALKIPVLTSNNSSLREIAGEENALLVNPDDANELRQGIKKILDDKILRQRLVTNGEKRAAEFSWEKTVRMLQTLIK